MIDGDKVTQILVEVANTVVRPRFRHLASGDIEQKAPGDYVTVADREAEKAIIEALKLLVGSALFIGEESVFLAGDKILKQLPEAELAYVIDPIDGTKNFVSGNEKYGLMVAEVQKGVTTRSWIWQPEFDTCYRAELGAGVYCNDKKIVPIERVQPYVGASEKKLGLHPLPKEVSELKPTAGAVAFNYPRLINGDYDFVYYTRLNPWDHLPGTLMVNELGGVVKTREGLPYCAGTSGRGMFSAANGQIFNLLNPLWP